MFSFDDSKLHLMSADLLQLLLPCIVLPFYQVAVMLTVTVTVKRTLSAYPTDQHLLSNLLRHGVGLVLCRASIVGKKPTLGLVTVRLRLWVFWHLETKEKVSRMLGQVFFWPSVLSVFLLSLVLWPQWWPLYYKKVVLTVQLWLMVMVFPSVRHLWVLRTFYRLHLRHKRQWP